MREKTTDKIQINPKEKKIKSKNSKTNSKRKTSILEKFRNLNGLKRSSNEREWTLRRFAGEEREKIIFSGILFRLKNKNKKEKKRY